MLWLDLCAGLGGSSQPALDRGWRVIRVDIDPRFKPDIVADIRRLPLKPFDIDVLWASPPCTEFSKAGMPASWACNRKAPSQPDIELTMACYRAMQYLKPRYWIIENVSAARKYLTPYLGPLYSRVAGHVFWGRCPSLLPDTAGHKWRLPPSPDRAALRARIPYEIGEAICIAVERRLGVYKEVRTQIRGESCSG